MIKRARVSSIGLGILATILGANAAVAANSNQEALAHLQLANAYVHAGKHNDAIAEYKTAYKLSPESKIGEYSLKALVAYKATPNVSTKSQTEDAISRQTQELRLQAERKLKEDIKVSDRIAKDQIARIEDDKNAAVNNVLANPSLRSTVVAPGYGGYYPTPFGYRYYGAPATVINQVDPVATQARVDLVKSRAEQAEKKVSQEAAYKQQLLKANAEERAKIIEESASNLSSQMTDSGTVKLDPNGTNLYVRSYRH